jgi:Asp-tRNA(Asn)/Glu-tRNA(Gln) amidotransferase A subunit family amidase
VIIETLQAYTSKEKTVASNVRTYLDKIKAEDNKFNAVIHLNPEALEQSKHLDQFVFENERNYGKLHGIPALIKANILTYDKTPTSCGSILLKEFYGGRDADIVTWLKKEGAIILGKSNMSEFSNYLSNSAKSGYSSLGGQTICIFGEEHSPGGSSSGAAVSIAAGLSCLSIGTETDGSVVYPAAHNGVYAFKFNADQFSTKGIIGISTFFDSIGIMTSSLSDLQFVTNLLLPDGLLNSRSINKVLIQKPSFYKDGITRKVLAKIEEFINQDGIIGVKSDILPNIESYFEYMDIICQTEFKANFTTNITYTNKSFLEACQRELVPKHFKDINEIERAFTSNFDEDGKYKSAISEICSLRELKQNFLKDEGIDLIIALTLGNTDVSYIANLIGLNHLVIRIQLDGDLPIGLSLMAAPENANLLFDFSAKLNLFLTQYADGTEC